MCFFFSLKNFIILFSHSPAIIRSPRHPFFSHWTFRFLFIIIKKLKNAMRRNSCVNKLWRDMRHLIIQKVVLSSSFYWRKMHHIGCSFNVIDICACPSSAVERKYFDIIKGDWDVSCTTMSRLNKYWVKNFTAELSHLLRALITCVKLDKSKVFANIRARKSTLWN